MPNAFRGDNSSREFWLVNKAKADFDKKPQAHPGDIVLELHSATIEAEDAFCLPYEVARSLYSQLSEIFAP